MQNRLLERLASSRDKLGFAYLCALMNNCARCAGQWHTTLTACTDASSGDRRVTCIIVVTKHAPMLIIKSIHTVTSDCHHVIAGRRGVLTEDLASQLRLEYVADGFANVEDVAVRYTRHALLLLCRSFKLRGAFERCHVAEGVLVRTPGHILDGDIATTTGAPCEPSRACPARAAALRALQRLATPAARGG